MTPNTMTPQEQFPKFYAHPERYLGIEVREINGRRKYPMDYAFLRSLDIDDDLQDWQPLFKPQQGEQFIKDLEDALFLACDADWSEVPDYQPMLGKLTYHHKKNADRMSVYLSNLEVLCDIPFDTAAYVDRMRELGYYL